MMFPLPFPQSGSSPYEGASGILKMGCELVMPHPLVLEQFGCGSVAGLHPLPWVQSQRFLHPSPSLPWAELSCQKQIPKPSSPAQYFSLQQSQGHDELRIIPTWDDALSSSLQARSHMPASPSARWFTASPSGDSETGNDKCPCKTGRLKREETNPFEVPWELLLGPW